MAKEVTLGSLLEILLDEKAHLGAQLVGGIDDIGEHRTHPYKKETTIDTGYKNFRSVA